MSNPVASYDFTIPAEKFDFENIKGKLKEIAKKWCFQKEKGEKTGYLHYQGRMSLKVKTREAQLRKELPGWHLSVTSTENIKNDFYVTKKDTRVDGPWCDKDRTVYIPRQIREIPELFKWQQGIIDNAKVWDTRTVNIIYDTEGNHGKTILKTYVGVHGIGRTIPFCNDYRDMLRMVMDTPKVPLYIIDIPRALRKDQLFQFFSAIETIKDGYAYDDRYCFKEEYFDCPNIWIFMNKLPELEMLSKDRWKIWMFNKEGILEAFSAQAVTVMKKPNNKVFKKVEQSEQSENDWDDIYNMD